MCCVLAALTCVYPLPDVFIGDFLVFHQMEQRTRIWLCSHKKSLQHQKN